MIEQILHYIVTVVEALGYPGVFIMSALESTFLPIPSEATLIPAGYLIHQGTWNGPLVFFLAVSGSLTGSMLNYWIARSCGRYLLVRYGKYFFMDEAKLQKMESFFLRHGPASIFSGRLIFGVRHFISFPAGLAKMDQAKFALYSATGAGLWTLVLLTLGYLIGNNKEEVMHVMPYLKVGFLALVGLGVYLYWRRTKHQPSASE